MAVLYTNDRDPLCKEYWLENGVIQRRALGSLASGSVEQLDVDDANTLGRVIDNMTQYQSLGLGNLDGVRSARLVLKGFEKPGEVSRSKRYIKHLPRPSFVLFDLDGGGMSEEVREFIESLGGLQAAIEYCAPNLLGCERLVNPSSSAGIVGLNAPGLHYYTRIGDGTQAKQIIETMHMIAWLKGLGWIKIADDGSRLVRSIIDVMVHSPERQVFEAKPIIHPPVVRKAAPMIVEHGGLFVPPLLTMEMEREYQHRVAEAKSALKEPARKIQAAWLKEQSWDKGIALEEFKRIWEGHAPLPDNLLLPDGRTVGDVLDESERLGQPILIHHPFFPDKGPSKAAILPRTPRYPEPILWSYLHGSRKHRFARYANPEVPAKFPGRGMRLEDGEAALQDAFEGASVDRRLIKATQGIGKTKAAIQAMSAFRGIVACFVRSHWNADELRQKFPSDVRVIVVRGRSHDGMCQNLKAVKQAIKEEKVVPATVCAVCPFRESCAYLKQERMIKKASRDRQPLVLILSHNYLHTGIPGDPTIDWAIVDEMPSRLFTVQSEISLPLGPFESVFKPITKPSGTKGGLMSWDDWLAYKALEDEGRALIARILASPALDIDLPADAKGWPWRDRFGQLIHGLFERNQFPHRVWWEDGKLTVSRLQEITLPTNLPLTFLDGTANPEIVRAVFGEDVEVIEIPVEREADVTYVIGRTFSNGSITGENQDADWAKKSFRFREELGLGFARHTQPFLAASKSVLGALGWTGPQRHFGALRGLNKYEDCETAIVLGRMLPPPEDVEKLARAFAGAAFHSIVHREWYDYRHEGLRMANGSAHAIVVECHPDPWGQIVLEQICDAEIAQAMDRVRAVRFRREIVLLTPRVVDITVDRVINWQDWKKGGIRAFQMVDDAGFALLSESEQARCFPELWSNRDSARDDATSKDWLANQPDGMVFTYRSGEKKRSKPHKAIAFDGLPTPAELADVVGPLERYRVEGYNLGEIIAALIGSAGSGGILIK